jgi:hypothetical protein
MQKTFHHRTAFGSYFRPFQVMPWPERTLKVAVNIVVVKAGAHRLSFFWPGLQYSGFGKHPALLNDGVRLAGLGLNPRRKDLQPFIEAFFHPGKVDAGSLVIPVISSYFGV